MTRSYTPAPAGTDPVAHWLAFNAERKARQEKFERDWLRERGQPYGEQVA